ncbi:hypothetical protein ABB37_08735 [Leptomonas pyrrhocoris]|uniref:Papain-like cysteine peptidase (DUF1796) n=1 Tax=Leptomonas pyrrhocoris TaxID=157538 RepID=A0A0M9FS97_LEPPY|nr:hypothetical protein ABB37_08735 [Leptomonas pyrrhocoris]KPA75050.1 hypothetical protein ABB37_08735 [Leptomonas pyrrhocoris]|eukprot:XP_015653489.1 hypothetical protein ABB37_08735 [Leptomonas pyrrhocoris]
MLGLSRRACHAARFDGASLPRKYISLGGWCGPALILGKLGLRTEAYPFDFSRVTMDGLLHFIQHGFDEGFYPPGQPPYTPECVGPWVLFRGQHTAFAHFDLNNPDVQAHFKTKIDRFHRVLDHPETPVTFFRTVTARFPQEELAMAVNLEAAIAQRNPHLDFRVVLMVHDQGLAATAAQLAPLSPRTALWTLQYREDPSRSLFDRTHDAYRAVVLHSVEEANWGASSTGVASGAGRTCCVPAPVDLSEDAYCAARQVYKADKKIRFEDVLLEHMTVQRFPWRSHDNLALIDGVASVGGTCAGIGSTAMLHDPAEPWKAKRCRYCGSASFHAAGRPFRTERPFTAEEDQLVLVHLYKILTGSDKVAAVEQLAHEMHRGTYEVICRVQFLTNASTKIMNSIDPETPP